MSEICAKLAKEAQGCEKMSFAEWVELRSHEKRLEKWLEQGRKDVRAN
jgi:hypothetical protein